MIRSRSSGRRARRAAAWVCAACSLLWGCGGGETADPRDLLVVVNGESPMSVAIGEAYQRARGLDPDQIVRLSVPLRAADLSDSLDETMTRIEFETRVRDPLAMALVERDAVETTRIFVVAKGIPLRIDGPGVPMETWLRDDTRASVDAELSLLFTGLDGSPGVVDSVNPYFDSAKSFEDFRRDHPEASLRYLVARLTGYQQPVNQATGVPTDVQALIDAATGKTEDGTWLLDEDPSVGVHRAAGNRLLLQPAAAALEAVGESVFREPTSLFASGWQGLLGYASWGSNDGADAGAPYYGEIDGKIFPGRFAARGVAVDFVSTNARSFTSPPSYGQSLVADLVRQGAAGVAGHVYEPTLSAVPRPHIFLQRYAQGVPAVEAYYRSIPYLGWQNVFVGDPLMTIRDGVHKADPSDRDGDGIADAVDNCAAVANEDQRDTDEDGFGNLCDGDVDGDGRVTTSWGRTFPAERRGDLEAIAMTAQRGPYDPNHDLDGNGRVDDGDIALASIALFLPPGPSGVAR